MKILRRALGAFVLLVFAAGAALHFRIEYLVSRPSRQ